MGSRDVDIGSMGGEERILSIVLSTSELSKLDLSNLQLFQANADHNNNDLYMNSEADPSSFFRETAGRAGLAEPVVFKSRAVMEAEISNSMPPQQRKKAASVNEMGFDCVVAEMENRAAQDYCTMGEGSPRGCRARRPAPLSVIGRTKDHTAVPLPEPQQVAKPRIDLKSSPASKFLVQFMPWELQPSPVTPFTTAAVPFKWEEAPGKPKSRADDQLSPRPALHLPPRLLAQPAVLAKRPPPPCPVVEPGASHRWSASSGSAEEKRVISIEVASEKLEGCRLDSELPLPWDGDVTLANSSLRDLGPPGLPRGAASAKFSALITMWRKKSSWKHNKIKSPPNNQSNKPKSLNSSGELLMQKKEHELWVNEEAETHAQSLNAIIAAAMSVRSEDFDFSKSRTMSSYSKNPTPIMNPEFYCSKMHRRTKRKWVLRKLRRPAQLFNSFFSAVWRVVWLRKWRLRSVGNMKQSYQSLNR